MLFYIVERYWTVDFYEKPLCSGSFELLNVDSIFCSFLIPFRIPFFINTLYI